METKDQLSITLPAKVMDRIRAQVAAGYYESDLEVIEDALDALEPEKEKFERWLCEEVIPACEEFDRDPSRTLTADEIKADIAAEYRNTIVKTKAG